MDESWLGRLDNWFDGYVQPFFDTDAEGEKNIRLKVEHTRRVRQAMDLITEGEGLAPPERRLAGAVALLHDVGRFPQYRRWRTFRDSASDNHARLAVEVVRAERLLDDLPPEERLMIEEAVRFHNLLRLPPRLKSPSDLFLRLIRDADKLDIWRVFHEVLSQPPRERASAALLDLPEREGVSPACVEMLAAGTIVRLDAVACVNDFRLLLVSWVFDLGFGTSFRLLEQSGHLDDLAAALPDDRGVRAALAAAMSHVRVRAGAVPMTP